MAKSEGAAAVAYVVERKRNDGTTRFLACYRDPEGRVRSAGTHATRRAAERAAHREEQKVLAGSWRDAALGAVSFRDYVENSWLPSKHIEPTTKAAYVSNLNKHFYPFFGKKLMYQITGSLVQDWVTQAAAEGLRLAGRVYDGRAVRLWLDEVARSAGAIWTGTTSRLYPATSIVGGVIDLPASLVGDFTRPSRSLQDTADVLRLAYNVSDETGEAQASIELSASPALYGGLPVERQLGWLRHASDAEAVGRRILGRMAGRRFDVSFTAKRRDIKPGQWLRPTSREWHVSGDDPHVMPLAA